MPMIFTPPLFSPDRERAVATDENGRFTVHGVSPHNGVCVKHSDYFDQTERFGERKDVEGKEIYLEQGETLAGKVTTRDGKALAGVRISDGAGKETLTDQNGAFAIRSPNKWWRGGASYDLSFELAGHIRQTLQPTKADPKGLLVILEPLLEIRGRVVSPDGKPVPAFTVMAGPGSNPAEFQCAKATVGKAQDGFVLKVESSGIHWLGVRADGYAAWEGSVKVARNAPVLTVTLKPGVAVTGKVKTPSGTVGPVEVALVPNRPDQETHVVDATPARDLATLRTRVAADGAFVIEHVRPDDYLLTISGKGITERTRAVKVTDMGATVAAIEVEGTGRIVGQLFYPSNWGKKGEWAFADGEIRRATDDPHSDKHLRFKTDEHGRFQVDGVPVGDIRVIISYWATADIVDAHVRHVRVIPGQTTEVRFFDPNDKNGLTFEFAIGDGSKEQFQTGTGMAAQRKVGNITTREPKFYIRLTPKAEKPGSIPKPDWHTLESPEHPRVKLADVSPGTYRVWVGDFLGSIGFHGELYQTEIEVKANAPPVRIPLGAGSVTGEVNWATDYRHMIQVLAVSEDGKMHRSTRCDDHGHFCVRYLPDGRWTLYAHDEKAGWCRIGTATVKADTKDIGEHKLAPGGTVTGKIALGKEGRIGNAVVAMDSHGFTIEALDFADGTVNEFAIGGLWPGTWTLRLMRGETILATAKVELKGTETVRCELSIP